MSLELYICGPKVGESILIDIEKGKGTILIDCADNLGAMLLEKAGIKNLDLLCLTHTHSDHINGALGIFEKYSPRSLITFSQHAAKYWKALAKLHLEEGTVLTTAEKESISWFDTLCAKIREFRDIVGREKKHFNYVRAESEKHIKNDLTKRFDGNLKIEIVLPVSTLIEPIVEKLNAGNPDSFKHLPNDKNEHPNNYCAALKISYHQAEILLLADATSEMVEQLVNEGITDKYTLIKASHHGSLNGNPKSFWNALNGKIGHVVLTRYMAHKLPNDDVLKSIASTGAIVHVTPLRKETKSRCIDGAGIVRGTVYEAVSTVECLKFSISRTGVVQSEQIGL